MKETGIKYTGDQSSEPKLALRISFPILGIIGMGISGYLTYIHFRNLKAICFFDAKCDAVLTSNFAQIWSIPLASFGIIMYAAITVLGFLLLWKKEQKYLISMGIYGLTLASLLFTIYLYYLEIFEIHAFCTWCLGSSIVVLILFVVSLFNLSAEGFNFKELPRYLNARRSRYIQW